MTDDDVEYQVPRVNTTLLTNVFLTFDIQLLTLMLLYRNEMLIIAIQTTIDY